MILNSAPQDEAVVANVSEVGEFRIRNSAKAFSILSSGLYANKIRAIIRELSCNAVDSHVAANKPGVPFDVHLPNTIEPWFSIRDYGTGLNHDQVTNIYTTYFESTKTASNEFIGALGLGSKSPFSYTDNFTVTAIQNGRKGIYTAFINEQGVPSIALMMEEETGDPDGVQVQFAVTERGDFYKFREEAANVYTYFTLRPVVSGGEREFKFTDITYESRDIVPGVHARGRTYHHNSVAIMGNIAYPIDVPNERAVLGSLASLLDCSLDMHFNIGELDFQASREGLSYVPSTIEAIKIKLEALNAALTVVLAKEANAIPNLWDRALFLAKKSDEHLWKAAVVKYVTDTKLPTVSQGSNGSFGGLTRYTLVAADIAKDWNIKVTSLTQRSGSKVISKGKPYIDRHYSKNLNGQIAYDEKWFISVNGNSHFIVSDVKTGVASRTAYHYREHDSLVGKHYYNRDIWILEKADKTKPMDVDAFFAAINEPPTDRRIMASTLKQSPRQLMSANVTLLKLECRGGYRRNSDEMVWRDAGKVSDYKDTETYYYVPLSGFMMQSSVGYTSAKEFYDDLNQCTNLFGANRNSTIFGVRKKDLNDIAKKPNWKPLEAYVTEKLATMDFDKLMLSLARESISNGIVLRLRKAAELVENPESPFLKLFNVFKTVDKFTGNRYNLERLLKHFAPNKSVSPEAVIAKYQTEVNAVNSRYPLITCADGNRVSAADIAEYINMCDAKRGI